MGRGKTVLAGAVLAVALLSILFLGGWLLYSYFSSDQSLVPVSPSALSSDADLDLKPAKPPLRPADRVPLATISGPSAAKPKQPDIVTIAGVDGSNPAANQVPLVNIGSSHSKASDIPTVNLGASPSDHHTDIPLITLGDPKPSVQPQAQTVTLDPRNKSKPSLPAIAQLPRDGGSTSPNLSTISLPPTGGDHHDVPIVTLSGATASPSAVPPLINSPDGSQANQVQVATVQLPNLSPDGSSNLKPVVLPPGSSGGHQEVPLVSLNTPTTQASPQVQTVDLASGGPSDQSINALSSNLERQITNLADDPDLLDPAQKARRFVMSMCRDQQGRLWLGCEPDTEDPKDGGAWCFDPSQPKDQQWKQYTIADGLGDNYIYAVACDRKGRIWAGHLNHGVSVYNGQKWQNYEIVGGLSRPDTLSGPLGERIFHITVNPKDGDIWMATNAGLARYSESKDTWSYYTRTEGLSSDQASSIAFDPDGNIYVATQCDGMAMANADDDYKTWRQVKGPDELPTTPTGDGLPTNLMNDVLAAKDGTVYAATDAGLTWSKDKGQTWKFVRGADWANKVRGLYGGAPNGWKETPGAILAEDYCTCLAEGKDVAVYVGHRQRTAETINIAAAQTAPMKTPLFTTAILADDGLQVATYGHSVALITPITEAANPVAALIAALPADAEARSLEALGQTSSHTQSPSAPLPAAEFLGDDWRTQGDWVGRYGRQYAKLCAADWPTDDDISYGDIFYRVVAQIGPNFTSPDGLRHWLHWDNPPYVRCLYDPSFGHRRQAEWDDHGEEYPMGKDGPDIRIHVELAEGVHRVTVYFVNKDGHIANNRFRDYMIQVSRTGDGHPSLTVPSPMTPMDIPGKTLVSARVCNFWGGVYKQFIIRGSGTFCFTLRRNNSFNTICSAVLIDRLVGENTFVDDLALPEMGNLPYDSPQATLDGGGSISTASLRLAEYWNDYNKECGPCQAWVKQVNLYRAAERVNADPAMLCSWRWKMRLWTESDRADFDSFMKKAYKTQKSIEITSK